MGYLTTIMFRNDSSGTIFAFPEKTIENILEAMHTFHSDEYGIAGDCNPMTGMGTSHADENRVYVQWGNSLFDIGYRDNTLSVEHRKILVKIVKEFLKEEERKIKSFE